MKSTVSGGTVSQSGSYFSRTGSGPLKKKSPMPGSKRAVPEQSCLSHKFMQATILALVIIMAFSVISMSILYVLNLQQHGSVSDVEGSRSVLGSARQASFSPSRVTTSTLSADSTSLSVTNHPPCCPPTLATTNQSATLSLLPGNNQSTPDSSTVVPTQATINKKAKSRPLDKESRNKNRLSHTSAPLFLSKAKRPPQPPEVSGATKRLPGGQQTPQRRQRSANTHDPTGCLSKLQILQTNQEIRELHCSSPETCSFTVFVNGEHNSSSSHVTLHMISSEVLYVWRCGSSRGRLCPNYPDSSFSLSPSTFTTGTSHVWSLPVLPFQEVTYTFRLSHSSQSGCGAGDEVQSSHCSEYSFLIHSTC